MGTINNRRLLCFSQLPEMQKTVRFVAFLILFLVVSDFTAQAQTIFVYDKQTGNPIWDVLLYNNQKDKTALTNEVGIADVSEFAREDIINFQHPSFNPFQIDLLSITQQKYRVALSPRLVSLEEVVVSANKWEANIDEIPNTIEIIEKKDIIFENPQTTADMLSSGNEVYVQKSQLGGGSPMLRGFSANKILFMVDGVKMNNAIYRSGNLHNVLQADVNIIESAEVIFGPGTNIYGSDALGGVIDVHTLNPKLTGEKKWTTSGHGVARLSSADFEKMLHGDVNFGNDEWAVMVSLTYSDFDDLKMGNMHNEYTTRPEYVKIIDGKDSIVQNNDPNVQRYSGYSQFSFISKIRQQFSKNLDWTYSFYLTSMADVPRYDRLLQYSGDALKYSVWNYHPQQWLMNSLEINLRDRTKIYDQASFTFAYQNVQEGRNDRKYQDEWLRKRKEYVNIISLNVDFDKSLRWGNSIFYGLEFTYNNVDSKATANNIATDETENISTRYPDGGTNYIQAGIYLSYKKNFSDIPLSFQAGGRISYVYLNSKFEDTSFYKLPYSEIKLNNGAITASAGLTYRPGNWQVKLNLSSGFRAPNLDDVAKIFDSEPGNVVVPNQNLKPEYLYNIDAGFVFRVSDIVKLEFTAFFSYLDDAMVRRDYQVGGKDSIYYDGELSKVQAIVNTGSAIIYGASFGFNAKIYRNLAFNTKLTYIKGEDDDGYALRHAPPLYGASSLIFEKEKLKLAVSAVYNSGISYENLAPSERSKAYLYGTDINGNPYSPGWWTLNFKGSYAFSKTFLVTFGIENIFNYRYRSYASGITAPGRNFIAAFRYSF